MEDRAARFFDTAYTHFVLRDLLGKALPGLFLVAGCTTALKGAEATRGYAEDMNAWGYVALAGLGWLTTTGIQLAVTETITNILSNLGYIEATISQPANWSSAEKLTDERLTVLKEATGNMALAMITVGTVCAAKHLLGDERIIEGCLYIALATCLLAGSVKQRSKQMRRRADRQE